MAKKINAVVVYNKQMRNLEIAKKIIDQTPNSHELDLANYLNKLLEIRSSQDSTVNKIINTVKATAKHNDIGQFLSVFYRVAKMVMWDSTSLSAKLAIAAGGAAAVATGGAGAGIAAAGGAIGVPLWIVVGGGGALAGTLLQEIKNKYDLTRRDADKAGFRDN